MDKDVNEVELNNIIDNNNNNEPKEEGINTETTAAKSEETNLLNEIVVDKIDDNKVFKKSNNDSLSPTSHQNNEDKFEKLKSTLKPSNRAWVDPWEAAVQDTFYHKELKTLRPTYDILNQSYADGVGGLERVFSEKEHSYDSEVNQEMKNEDLELKEQEKAAQTGATSAKFGAWDGVAAGCLLNIFGVIMFLRVGWMVGQAGILQALGIILISAIVTTLTTLSMSAICTNGQIKGGGAYYIISRALGPSAGGAIGILFSLGMMVAVSLYLVGFAETLQKNLLTYFGVQIFANKINDVRLYSNLALIFCLILALIGLKYVIKAQLVLLGLIVISIICLIIGGLIDWPKKDFLYGYKGFFNGNIEKNMFPEYVEYEGTNYNFWLVLAVFFPAVTGIMAGANISGDLRNPSTDIPKGTITAVIISTIVYMGLAILAGAVARRNMLIENELIFADMCLHFSIILAGIYAATLSSGIASLVGAPRILMAIGQDKILPWKWLTFFSTVNNKGEPIRGYFLSFVVAAGCNCIGALNAIAPIISMFFMLAYFMINLACFMLSISKSPGWRPSFKYYNKYTAISGSILCVIVMFLLEWRYALVCCFIGIGIFIYILLLDPVVNWGTSIASRGYYDVYKSLYKLKKSYKGHVKNWRPGFLILVDNPVKKPQLLLWSQTLRKSYAPIFFATIHTGDYRTNIAKYKSHMSETLGYLPSGVPCNPKGFYEVVLSSSFRSGFQNLLQLSGMGSMRPNVFVIGFKDKWQKDNENVVKEYVNILRDGLMMGFGCVICCGFNKINWVMEQFAPPAINQINDDYEAQDDQIVNYNHDAINEDEPVDNFDNRDDLFTTPKQKELDMAESEKWMEGQLKSTYIDVWFMIDDGGLPLLLGNIMKRHPFWSKCKLRLNLVCDENNISFDVLKIEQMLSQFRLEYLPKPRTIMVKQSDNPSNRTVLKFEKLAGEKLKKIERSSVIKRWLKTCELMYKHSKYSGLNLITLPIPHKKIKSKTYMALLDMMSDQERLPPTIFVRGNGVSVLTFYSD